MDGYACKQCRDPPPTSPSVRCALSLSPLAVKRIRTFSRPLGQPCAERRRLFERNMRHRLPQASPDNAALLRGSFGSGDCRGERLGGPAAGGDAREMGRHHPPGVFGLHPVFVRCAAVGIVVYCVVAAAACSWCVSSVDTWLGGCVRFGEAELVRSSYVPTRTLAAAARTKRQGTIVRKMVALQRVFAFVWLTTRH